MIGPRIQHENAVMNGSRHHHSPGPTSSSSDAGEPRVRDTRARFEELLALMRIHWQFEDGPDRLTRRGPVAPPRFVPESVLKAYANISAILGRRVSQVVRWNSGEARILPCPAVGEISKGSPHKAGATHDRDHLGSLATVEKVLWQSSGRVGKYGLDVSLDERTRLNAHQYQAIALCILVGRERLILSL